MSFNRILKQVQATKAQLEARIERLHIELSGLQAKLQAVGDLLEIFAEDGSDRRRKRLPKGRLKSAVLQAIAGMKGQFIVSEVEERLRGVLAKRTSLSAVLRSLATSGEISCVQKGSAHMPSVYRIR